MKLQFYFDHVERDLLRSALERWLATNKSEREAQYDKPKSGHFWAGNFTDRRIKEMLARLQEPTGATS